MLVNKPQGRRLGRWFESAPGSQIPHEGRLRAAFFICGYRRSGIVGRPRRFPEEAWPAENLEN